MRPVSYLVTGLTASAVRRSRDRPNAEIRVDVDGSICGVATVPADGAQDVIAVITGVIADRIVGRTWSSLSDVDAVIRDAGEAVAKGRLGSVATLGASVAAARAFAADDGLPLYRWLPSVGAPRLPVPYVKLVSGGPGAGNRLDFREFMVVPVQVPTFADALRVVEGVHRHFGEVLGRIGFSAAPGDDGSFAPALQAPEDVLDLLCEAVADAGYRAGGDGVAIALNVDATRSREASGAYRVNGSYFDAVDMVEYLAYLVDRYPICSLEDGMARDDAKGRHLLAERLGGRVQVVGHRDVVTLPGASAGGDLDGNAGGDLDGNAGVQGAAVLIEPSQAGTVSAILEAAGRCSRGGAGVLVSTGFGDPVETFDADVAVAIGCGQIKAGAPQLSGGEATYRRLVAIESEAGDLPYGRARS